MHPSSLGDLPYCNIFIRKQEQTLFKRAAAGLGKVLIGWQSFTATRKQKSLKNSLKAIFEVEGAITQKVIKSKRSGTP